MNSNYFKVITLALQAAAEVQEIQPLHNEERFDAIKIDAIQTLQLAGATFFPGDKLAQAILNAAVAGINTVNYADVTKPKSAPAPADSASTAANPTPVTSTDSTASAPKS